MEKKSTTTAEDVETEAEHDDQEDIQVGEDWGDDDLSFLHFIFMSAI